MLKAKWLFLLVPVLLNCGGGKKSHKKKDVKLKVTEAAENIKDFDYRLSGGWVSNCLKTDLAGLGSHRKEAMFVPSGKVVVMEYFYAKSDCQENDLSFTYRYQGKVDKFHGKSGEDEVRDLDMQVSIQEVIPKSSSLKDWLNRLHVCSVTDWKTDKAQDITEKGCSDWFIGDHDTIYDVYNIDSSNKLRFGVNTFFNKGSQQTRPSSVSKDMFLERANGLDRLSEMLK